MLEALRQPLEDARVVVSRSAGTVVYRARFLLVAAANPCRRGCASLPTYACAPPERARYLGRLSRPLLDRIDLHLEIPALSHAELTASAVGIVRPEACPVSHPGTDPLPFRCHFGVRLWGIPGFFEVSRPS